MSNFKKINKPSLKRHIRIIIILFIVFFYIIAGLSWLPPIEKSRWIEPVYVILAPLAVILLTCSPRASWWGSPQTRRVKITMVIMLVLSAVSAIVAHYELWVSVFIIESEMPVKSLVFGILYKLESEGTAISLHNAILSLMILSFLINGSCWLICAWYNKNEERILTSTFLNAGIMSGMFRCLRYLHELDFTDDKIILEVFFGGSIRNGIFYSAYGLLCATIFCVFLTIRSRHKRSIKGK